MILMLEWWANCNFSVQKSFARCHFSIQKRLDFQGPPLSLAHVMDLPHQTHYIPHHINNRFINSYYLLGDEASVMENSLDKQRNYTTIMHLFASSILISMAYTACFRFLQC